MRIFVAVAECAGFAAAGRQLKLSPPVVTRAVATLEEHIGARLLSRTTRTVRLTESGQRFLTDAKRILAEVAEAEASAAGAHGELRGTLTVTAPTMFGRMHVAPVLCEFLGKHRGVTSRGLFVDRVVNLAEEGIDVAVRIAHLADSSLTAVRIGSVRRVLVASPTYLKKHRKIRTPKDLLDHDCFGVDSAPMWTFGEGGPAVQPRMRLIANTPDVTIAAALAGQGVTRAASYQVAQRIRDGSLVYVLHELDQEPIPVHVVYLEGAKAAKRCRAFVDFAVPRLRAVLDAAD
jgi:DNA-binding transcriptional LysR family regulator